jgi:hypothetical protein
MPGRKAANFAPDQIRRYHIVHWAISKMLSQPLRSTKTFAMAEPCFPASSV